MRGKREIQFPFFLHCCRETEDKYWKYVFEDLAYGLGPYGVYFTKGFMCCGFKGKEFSYKLDPYKATNEIYTQVRSLLQNKLGIRSHDDMILQRKTFEETERDFFLYSCDDWSEIRKKEIRDLLLKKFVISKSKKEEWARSRTKKFLSALMLALQLKVITHVDIEIKGGEILSIQNLDLLSKGIRTWEFEWSYRTESVIKKYLMSP